MSCIDYFIFGLYMLVVIGVGLYRYLKNKSAEGDMPLGLDPSVFGITISAVLFIAFSYLVPDKIIELKKR